MSQTRYWDEAVYLQNAEVICCAKTNYSELGSRPPLLSLIFAAVFKLRHSIYAVSLVTVALNALGPLILYLVGRRLAGRKAAALAALLLGFLPFFVQEGNRVLTDSPALILILVCFWMQVTAGDEDKAVWPAGAGLVGGLAVLMRFASLPTIAVLSLLCLAGKRRLRSSAMFTAGFAVAMAPYLLWSRLRHGGFLATMRHGWENVAGSVEPWHYYVQNFATVFSWLTVAGLTLWLVTRFVSRDHSSLRWDLFLCGWIVIVLAYYSAIPHKELRYILPLAPPLLLLAGRGLAELWRIRNAVARRAAVAVIIVGLAITFAPTFGRLRGPLVAHVQSEEQQVSDYLKEVAPNTATLYANFNYPVFAYYTGLPTRVLLEQGDAFYNGFPHNMPADGYLVLYRDLDKDPRMDWVDSNSHFRRVEEFPSLVVYRYRVKPE